MLNVKTFAAAAIIAAFGAAAPAAAALVNYTFSATNVDYNYANAVQSPTFAYSSTSGSTPGVDLTTVFTFDTSVSVQDIGNPTGSVPYVYLRGGSDYGQPASLSALSTLRIGASTLASFQGDGQTESFVIGTPSEINLYTNTYRTTMSIDPGTGDTLRFIEISRAHALMSSTAGIVNMAGTWVPGVDLNAVGQLYVTYATGLERYSANGNFLGATYFDASLYSNMARMVANVTSNPVPEPGALGIFGLGLLAVAVRRRKRVG